MKFPWLLIGLLLLECITIALLAYRIGFNDGQTVVYHEVARAAHERTLLDAAATVPPSAHCDF